MATSSFTTEFVIPTEALKQIVEDKDKPVERFRLSDKDRSSIKHSREIFEKCFLKK